MREGTRLPGACRQPALEVRQASSSLEDSLEDHVRRLGRLDHREPFRLGGGQRQEAVPYPSMEVDIERRLEAGHLYARLPAQTGFGRKVEQDRQVRLEAAGCEVLQDPKLDQREALAEALVSEGRVGEARCDDELAAGE